jgi:hypothetical protein
MNLPRLWGSHSGGYEQFCLLGYNVVFRRNMSPPYSGSMNTPYKKPAWSTDSKQSCFLAWTILRTWRRRRNVPPKRRNTINLLHGIIPQKIGPSIFFIYSSQIRCNSFVALWRRVSPAYLFIFCEFQRRIFVITDITLESLVCLSILISPSN